MTTVMTRQGRLEGELGPHGVRVFRGIPYAQPPIGALRFRAPEPASAWSGTRDARSFGASAPQDAGLIQDLGEQSEACLFLNVWAPANATESTRKPVMVWIHGGSFTVGSASQQLYDGSELCGRGDVVVVTINYRLGALGFAFLCDVLTDSAVSGNNGLRDQLAALGWVRDNIAAFGGDPENVTLFGESAGAMSVGALLACPSARGLFRRAIAQSGGAHHCTTRAEATRMAELMLRGLSINPKEPQRLWQVSTAELVRAQRLCANETILRGPVGGRLPQGAMTLIPVGDGELLPEDPFTSIAHGAAESIDLLIGSTLDEWNYFLFLVEPKKRDIDESVLIKICDKRTLGRGQEVVSLYRSVLGAELAPYKIYAAIESDRMFRIPALRLAEAQSALHPRTFMYLFDWPSPLFDGELGACHAIEIPFVFGTVEGPFGRAFTGGGEQANQLSKLTLHAWTQFARNGNPSHEALQDWPAFDTTNRQTMRLGPKVYVEQAPLEPLRKFWINIQ